MTKKNKVKTLQARIDCYCTHSFHEQTKWGSWEESYDNHFSGIKVVTGDNYYGEKLEPGFQVKAGDVVYVVWAEWSTGNSFGRGHRNRTEVMEVFMDSSKALACADILENGNMEKDEYGLIDTCDIIPIDKWTVTYKNELGKDVPCYRPWLGYFESLDGIYVETVVVGAQ